MNDLFNYKAGSVRGPAPRIEPREAFRTIDVEGDAEVYATVLIEYAADAANCGTDRETVRLFARYRVEPPERLRDLADSMFKYETRSCA